MASNPTSVTKFRALHALDRFLGDPDADARNRNLEAALQRLDDPEFDLLGPTVAGIEAIADDGAPAPLEHLKDHWLSGQFFPGLSNEAIRTTIREGFRSAIRDALEEKLPLQAVWVCATEDSKAPEFRVDHVTGSVCVTVAIITPRPVRSAAAT